MTLDEILTLYTAYRHHIYARLGTCRFDAYDDYRNFEWFLTSRNEVVWFSEPINAEEVRRGTESYHETIDGEVIRKEGLAFVPQDGCPAMVFEERKECKDQALIDLWEECWR